MTNNIPISRIAEILRELKNEFNIRAECITQSSGALIFMDENNVVLFLVVPNQDLDVSYCHYRRTVKHV